MLSWKGGICGFMEATISIGYSGLWASGLGFRPVLGLQA